jgi:YVTN family beta-propeller protein
MHEYDAYTGDAFPNTRKPLTIPAGGALFTTNSYSDSVSVLDAITGDTLGTYPVGRDPVTLDGPHHVVVSPLGDAVYVALSYPPANTGDGPHAAHGSSTRAGYAQKLDINDMHIMGQERVDNNPGEIVISGDGKHVITSHFDLKRALANPTNIDAARATIAVMDTSTMELTNSPAPLRIPTCVAPHGAVLSQPDGATAYVACYGEDVVAIVDTVKGTVNRVPVAAGVSGFGNPQYGPYSASMSPAGDLVAIGDTASKDVRFLDTATAMMVPARTLPMLGAPYFPAWSADGKTLVVPMQAPDAIVVVDLDTKAELLYRGFTGDECISPHVVTRMEDGSYALVCEGDHEAPGKVIWLDPLTLATKHSTNVGVYPDALAFFRKVAP